MNNLTAGENSESVIDEDAIRFYASVSRVVGKELSVVDDVINVTRPPWQSRNSAQHALVCDINTDRRVVLKRCSDSPEFLRREQLVHEIKLALELPAYSVIGIEGVILRSLTSNSNCEILKGWEDKPTLIVHYGNPNFGVNLANLQPSRIRDLKGFCFSYGSWCAFDYLFGVRDRNAGNFVFFTDTQTLHSVDNEEGPFSTDGRFIGVDDIITATKQNVERFVNGNLRAILIQELRSGFVNMWETIKRKVSLLGMLNEREKELLNYLLTRDPVGLSQSYV